MALQPTQKNEEQRLRAQLRRDKASLETKKSSRGVALDISTDPKETAARRAQFAARYKKLNEEIADLEDKIDTTTKDINKAQARKSLDVYDEVEGQKQLTSIKEKYALLEEAYKLDEDPDIKAKIDTLVQDYKDVSTSVIGRPISLVAARSALTGSAPTFGTPTGTTPAPAAVSGPTGTPAQPPRVTTGGTTGGTNIPGVTMDKTSGGTTGGITSIAGSGKAIPSNFDVGTFRAADEASMAAAEGITPGATVRTYDEALLKAQKDFNLPDIIFSNVKSLGDLLDRYVNPKKYGKNGISDINQFIQLVQNDPWFRQNSTEIKARYLQKFNYDDLVKSGQAKGTTDYEQKIAQITNDLIKQARTLGAVVNEADAKLIAEDLYIYNQDADEAVKTRRLVNFIRPMAGMIGGKITEDFSGLALQNYEGLQKLAKRNGLKLENILPPGVDGKPATAEETLKRLALGEIDPTRLASDVRKLAAIGQPQFVRELLGQGIDLDEIYSPYRRTMARILELDEGQIDLMDPTLRMGINEKGDVNLYDFEKALRQDSRWQYTGDARQKVSDSALTVLRNFGFQG
jgi:hypothetical protein